MNIELLQAAARTTENDNARYWWVWVIVILIMVGMAAKFYVDKIKKK